MAVSMNTNSLTESVPLKIISSADKTFLRSSKDARRNSLSAIIMLLIGAFTDLFASDFFPRTKPG